VEQETLETPATTSKKRLKKTIEIEEEENRNPNPSSKSATDQQTK
jgi:hypothetical protein